MHEFSIASGALETARERAREHGATRIDALELAVGEASHVNPDQLETCLDAAATDTMAAEADVDIETVPPYAECGCGWSGEPEGLDPALAYAPDLACPACGDRLTLSRGDGCYLVRIEVTTPDDGPDDPDSDPDAAPTAPATGGGPAPSTEDDP